MSELLEKLERREKLKEKYGAVYKGMYIDDYDLFDYYMSNKELYKKQMWKIRFAYCVPFLNVLMVGELYKEMGLSIF